MFYKN